MNSQGRDKRFSLTRRDFLLGTVAGAALGLTGNIFYRQCSKITSDTFIGKASTYNCDITSIIISGFLELGITSRDIEGKRILLKPNMVESRPGTEHICTHPAVINGAIEAFFTFGASEVIVGEGSANCRDPILLLETTEVGQVMRYQKTKFIDLNNDSLYTTPNKGRLTSLSSFTLPLSLRQVDWIVSMPKLKTHHWAGVTLSMKNMFGTLPGIVYGWPKNTLHIVGIDPAILDINATIQPHFAIVDGIVGMEGDGPIMGTPHQTGVIVMGGNLTAVDATCARIMDIEPEKINYLKQAGGWLGPIQKNDISQRGEQIFDVKTEFGLKDNIPALNALR